jgi:predicted Zn-dependent protease
MRGEPSLPNEPTGNLATALQHAARLLVSRPSLAVAQAREILKVVPDNPEALALLGEAEGRLGESGAAIRALSRAVALKPDLAGAWRALGDALTLAGDGAGADAAYARHIHASVKDPQLLQAAAALCENRLAVAERLLREFLMAHPTDVAAIRMLAETGARLGRYEDAEKLLARCLELAPGFDAARHNYASVLYRENKQAEALAQTDLLLAREPRNPNYRSLRAAALARIGDHVQAIACYEAMLQDFPDQPAAWMSYGHTLKAVGRQGDCVAAYRKSIALRPALGEAWWSLANLKTFRFTTPEIAAMQAALARSDISDEDRFHLQFALGKALEDAALYAESFDSYLQANALRRAGADYNADEITDHVRRSMALFSREFFAARQGMGSDAPDPIFIVGLPRAGSTLIEQILASHSAIEGTMELPDMASIARRIGGKKRKSDVSTYPEMLCDLKAEDFAVLGEEYLARTQIQRRLGRPFFIDKMPNNFAHVGLIHLVLPNARIVDARRHPLGCCFSAFKQHFARGQNFTYNLTDLGRYYSDYVTLMAHFDRVLPGRVHRVIYEQLVADPEGEVRRLLSHCGVAFEDSCLRYYETDRAVRTASSEQVRMPIFKDAVDQWRHFEPWLEPLKTALGSTLTAYPSAPSL